MRFDRVTSWNRRIVKRDISQYCYDKLGNIGGKQYRGNHLLICDISKMLRIHRLFLGVNHPCVGCGYIQWSHLNEKKAITARKEITRYSHACCMKRGNSLICRNWTERKECFSEHSLLCNISDIKATDLLRQQVLT